MARKTSIPIGSAKVTNSAWEIEGDSPEACRAKLDEVVVALKNLLGIDVKMSRANWAEGTNGAARYRVQLTPTARPAKGKSKPAKGKGG